MPLNADVLSKGVCAWIDKTTALKHFAVYTGSTQSQQHIKPLHWYVACRLVIEGGFRPEDITPRPPFSVVPKKGEDLLNYTPEKALGGERTILGGLKTKNVDVVVTKNGLGPVMAISCKGAIGAFRNLTNRMEEAVGDCTNLHITYPAMVAGYLFVMRANREPEQVAVEIVEKIPAEQESPSRKLQANDIAIQAGGDPVESVFRFHTALRELTGRRGIRNDVSRYEAVSLALIEAFGSSAGVILDGFPAEGSPLRFEQFFSALYLRYDERFVYSAPDLKKVTSRIEWSANSPVFEKESLKMENYPDLDFEPRIREVTPS